MTDPGRPEPGGQRFDDPTRDIRWPPSLGGTPPKPPQLTDEPTDELPERPVRRREPTLQFDKGAGFPRPAPSPRLPEQPARRRKWPWAMLVLLPVVVIVGSGLWLLVLLSHG